MNQGNFVSCRYSFWYLDLSYLYINLLLFQHYFFQFFFTLLLYFLLFSFCVSMTNCSFYDFVPFVFCFCFWYFMSANKSERHCLVHRNDFSSQPIRNSKVHPTLPSLSDVSKKNISTSKLCDRSLGFKIDFKIKKDPKHCWVRKLSYLHL